MDLSPGDLVEYVGQGDAPPQRALGTIKEVFEPPPGHECDAGCGLRMGLIIREHPLPFRYSGWCACSWRPVARRTDLDHIVDEIAARAHDLIPAKPLVRA